MNCCGASKNIIILIVFLLVVAFGFLLIFSYRPGLKIDEEGIIDSSEYSIQEVPEGKVIEIENMKAVAPAGWEVREEGNRINLFSPEVSFDDKGFVDFENSMNGCSIVIQVKKNESSVTKVKALIEEIRNNPEKVEEGYRLTVVDGNEAVKKDEIENGFVMKSSVEAPVGDSVFSFRSGEIFSPVCVDDFGRFVSGVEIGDGKVDFPIEPVEPEDCLKAGRRAGGGIPLSSGESEIYKPCCEGLISISEDILQKGTCRIVDDSGWICSDCGNNTCEEWENSCNCPEDCEEKITE